MIIKIKLATGKEVKLTLEELNELLTLGDKTTTFVPLVQPYPGSGWPLHPNTAPIITYSDTAS